LSNHPEQLRRQIAELQAQLARFEAADPSRRVDGGVHIAQGDFVAGNKVVVEPGEDEAEVRSLIQAYLQGLSHDLAGLRLGDIDASATDVQRGQPLRLADVYVPLDTTLEVPKEMSLAEFLKAGKAADLTGHEAKKSRRVPATGALAQHRVLLLLGAPGSGKSSFGARMLLAMAQAWLGHASELEALGPQWAHGTLLPLRVVLRRFADDLPAGNAPARAGDLWQHIEHELGAAGWGPGQSLLKHIRRIERRSGLLVLFDGLDECGSETQRDRVRVAVEELVANGNPNNRYLLTARPYAGPKEPSPARGEYLLAPLDEAQVDTFVERWYAALTHSGWLAQASEAPRKKADLQAATRRADLRNLAANPLLLTLMASLHTQRTRLPDDRADLYHESVNLLLQRWTQAKGGDQSLEALVGQPLRFDLLRSTLEQLAFEIHEASAGRSPATQVAIADIGEDRLIRALAPLLDASRDRAVLAVDFIERRAGLLLGQGHRDGERQFSFPHRTFQEFLSAAYLARRDRFAAECKRLAQADAGHWQVVLPLAARLAGPERGALAADELVGGVAVEDPLAPQPRQRAHWDQALLAGLQLQEIGVGAVNSSASGKATLRRVAGWLAASLPVHPSNGGADAPQRAYAGEVLATLGDPRFDADLFHLPRDPWLGFVQVPEDPAYVIGTRQCDRKRVAEVLGADVADPEINDQPVAVPRFWIARHLVTVVQFGAWLAATGREPGDPEALRAPANHPVARVNWHEAREYCQWLGRQLQGHPRLNKLPVADAMRRHGLQASLPSELEWERAARADRPGAVFPYGDVPDASRANAIGSGIDRASSVGCFEPNALGLHDLAGNTCEWTRNDKQPYPYQPHRRRTNVACLSPLHAVCGGSYFSELHNARCAKRIYFAPDVHDKSVGFRVVLRCSPDY
jgi:Sulfatase-modifying factor enzyme 1/NACHT domain